MLRNFRVLILLALAALAWNVTPAYSTTLTTYTDLASWQAATSGDLTADFEGLTPGGPVTSYNTASGVSSYPNVQFIGLSSSGSYLLDVEDTSYVAWAAYRNFGTGDALSQLMDRPTNGSPLPYIHVVFSTPVTAFGSDLFTSGPNALSFAITVLGTQYTVATNPLPTTAFWGVTSDTPIASADFTLQGTTFNGGSHEFLDNFRYGTAQTQGPPPDDTPEAATMLLIGSGLIGLAYLRKRTKPMQTA
jgi:hypothetical protein